MRRTCPVLISTLPTMTARTCPTEPYANQPKRNMTQPPCLAAPDQASTYRDITELTPTAIPLLTETNRTTPQRTLTQATETASTFQTYPYITATRWRGFPPA